VVHLEELTRLAPPVKATGGSRSALAALAAACTLAGCEDAASPPVDPAFGQTGRIQVEVRSLLPGGDGFLDEILIWASNGPWLLTERVSYLGNGGGETIRSSRLNPGELAREYGSLIRQLNEAPGLALFDGAAPQELHPECGTGGLPFTRVTFTIEDETGGESARWSRCADGTYLPSNAADPRNLIAPGNAAPDAGAARVITAAQLVRSFTVGDLAVSTYRGTTPFASLEQGEDSPAERASPQVFASSTAEPPASFAAFWADHAGSAAPLPRVSWQTEMVLLVAVGERDEAGVEVRIRRVLPLGVGGTRVEVTERVPGDFCSPAARATHPYQLVVLPSGGITLPIEFTAPRLERIPCGA
jgi:hypothetical protein